MKFSKESITEPLTALKKLLTWMLYACVVGVVAGLAAIAFHYGVDWANSTRAAHPWIIWLLPLGGIAIVVMYKVCGMERDLGTNFVLLAVREAKHMKLRTAPLIFLSTIVTHLLGGSAGREGAALQLGGSIAGTLGERMDLDEKSERIMVMCGMSAAFSALFGTPMTAALFAMEVISVGVMYYVALVPCLISAIVAFQMAVACGLHEKVGYTVYGVPDVDLFTVLKAVLLGGLCAMVSVLFCWTMETVRGQYQKWFENPILRAAVGGLLVAVLTLIVGSQDYSGAGDPLIHRMLGGERIPVAFLLKILFTALTLGAGFRGGEIVPALCTGCAFGSLMGPFIGLNSSFAGAMGMAAVFCGTTNCPLTAVLMAAEMFGTKSLALCAVCCSVSYMMSGYWGLYSAQKIVYSKLSPEWVDRKAK